MIKRYDIAKDQMIEVTQEYFDGLQEQLKLICSDYKNNDPQKFNEFFNKYFKVKYNNEDKLIHLKVIKNV